MSATSTFVLQPITSEAADALRAMGGRSYVSDSKPGYPCRQCLCDVEIGEELILVSHDPFTKDSPYRSASPIFLHRDRCAGPADTGSVPDQLALRRLSVRSFDADEMMLAGKVVDGQDLAATLDELFQDPESRSIHVHNAERGCWAVTAVRVPGVSIGSRSS